MRPFWPASAADRFVKVFNVADGKLVRSFEGHTHHVLDVTWKSDGKVLASCGADNVIKVWDFITGDQLRTTAAFEKEVTAIDVRRRHAASARQLGRQDRAAGEHRRRQDGSQLTLVQRTSCTRSPPRPTAGWPSPAARTARCWCGWWATGSFCSR